ncbi:MAG TPA: MBL fold metallo-hydrolase [Gemmatimonadales bacterium]
MFDTLNGTPLPFRHFLPASWLVILASSLSAQEPTRLVVRDNALPCLNMRTRPESSAPAFECLPPSTVVEAIGAAPYWRQVKLADDRTGWVAKKFLEAAAGPAPTPADADRDDAWLEVHVVDVGQGDGIWIHTFDDNIPGNGRYEGYNIIIDGGPDASDVKNRLLRYVLDKAHERAVIDALIITHPHDDHYPGAEGILRHFEVREFYDSGYPKQGIKWHRFRALVDSEKFEGHPIVEHVGRANFGTPDWGSELRVHLLYAYPGSGTALGSGNTLENNASIVLRLECGSQSILFMGDAEGKDRADGPDVPKYAERFLLDSVSPAALRSTVLKIAHHGSETSSTLPFINAVDPKYVVVSSGRKSFGGIFLPDATTLERYCAHKAATRIYRTDQDDEAEGRTTTTDADGDDIVISTNGDETRVVAYSSGRPITMTSCVP